jgi:hypothetical protein
MFDHYDLMMWVFELCIIIAALLGIDIAFRVWLHFTDDE